MKGEGTMFDDTCCTPFQYDENLLLWLTYKCEDGNCYYVVSNNTRTEYCLFKNKRKLAKTSNNPLDLYKYIKER